jgi:hypothetical protein
MTKTMIVLAALLTCSFSWAANQGSSSAAKSSTVDENRQIETSRKQAQHQGNTGQNTMANERLTGMNGNEVKMDGCLSRSADSYMLIDASGTGHQLHGDPAELAKLINNEVVVEGTLLDLNAELPSPGSGIDSVRGPSPNEIINSATVKKTSNSCTSTKM